MERYASVEGRRVMRRVAILLVLFASLTLLIWRVAAPPVTGHAFGNGPSGAYAFLETIHDPVYGTAGLGGSPGTGQEGSSVGTLVFNNGALSGVYSQNTRGCTSNCGYLQLTRVPFDGTYTLYSDGSVTMNLCLHIASSNVNPPQPPQNVHVIWEGAFSTFFIHLRFIQTQLGLCEAPGVLNPTPNVTSATADKV